jgi:exodeoxyribonuclease VII large subunit
VLTDEPAPRSWSVAALLLAASDALQARLGAVAVRGELSGFTRAASGHCYFTLKDGDGQAAVLRCAMFRRAAVLVDFRPADGQQVELRGRIGVYEARGELQCVVESMQRLGSGSLYELFLRTRARLEAAGLFDAARKRSIAAHPRRIGVVTSLAAAALHDVLTAIARRAPHVKVIVYPAPVQGPEAPAQLARAIQRAGERAEVDTLIVCRGGGSLEDLWAFNDEQVVRAVAASPLPVVCGVGHETDVCLAELAADLRAPTPTAAAELATPHRADEVQRLARLQAVLSSAVQRRLDGHAQRLDRLALRLGRPARLVDRERARLLALAQRAEAAFVNAQRQRRWRLEPLRTRVQAAAARRLAGERERLAHLAVRLDAADPRRVLMRGYAWLADADGHAVTSARALQLGQRLSARWADGSAEVDVVRIDSGAVPGGPKR